MELGGQLPDGVSAGEEAAGFGDHEGLEGVIGWLAVFEDGEGAGGGVVLVIYGHGAHGVCGGGGDGDGDDGEMCKCSASWVSKNSWKKGENYRDECVLSALWTFDFSG